MDTTENYSSIISDVLPLISTLLSLLGSYFIARHAARNEIKKLELTAKREDSLSERKAYLDVSTAVSAYIYDPDFDLRRDAISAISAARIIKHGYVGDLLDELRIAVASDDRQKAEDLLSAIYANWTDIEKI